MAFSDFLTYRIGSLQADSFRSGRRSEKDRLRTLSVKSGIGCVRTVQIPVGQNVINTLISVIQCNFLSESRHIS